jgi:hypothetical protein
MIVQFSVSPAQSTSSSYEQPSDGSETAVLALADEASEDIVYLIARTPHYAWLR